MFKSNQSWQLKLTLFSKFQNEDIEFAILNSYTAIIITVDNVIFHKGVFCSFMKQR